MSDDTPTGETEPTASPAGESVEPTPAPEPAAATADATAAEPVAAEPVTADATDDPTAVPAATATAPPPPPPERRNGILVPTWAAIVVAILLIGGLGFAIGYWTADDDGADASNASSSQLAPNRGGTDDNRGGESGGGFPNGNVGPNAAQIAFLGVELESAADNGGARISNVRPSSPAADAGLKSGDVVTEIDDTTIADDDDLIRAVRAHQPGDEVTVTYTRDGNTAQATVTLGDRSDATRSSVSP